MIVAVADFCSGNNDYIISALTAEAMRLEPLVSIEDAGSAQAVLILARTLDAEPLGFIAGMRMRRPAVLQLALADGDDVERRLAAYEAGVDDCLFKPFHFRELVAKLRAFGRRSAYGVATPLLAHASVVVDQTALELRVDDRATGLTKREADLLVLLARAEGGVVRREDVIRDAWGAPAGVTGNLVDVYVGYARRKLVELGSNVQIRSVRGEGFRLDCIESSRQRT